MIYCVLGLSEATVDAITDRPNSKNTGVAAPDAPNSENTGTSTPKVTTTAVKLDVEENNILPSSSKLFLEPRPSTPMSPPRTPPPTPEMIRPLHKALPRKRKATNRRKLTTEILTDTPVKDSLETYKAETASKEACRIQKVKKQVLADKNHEKV
ncbi:hypothetical protein FQA39_LY02014 [Lamprigera yunnana]|nr:hypothetical protein FQA39_LY02014 [Lamprigera yunnana]